MNPIIIAAKQLLTEDISSKVHAYLSTAIQLFEDGSSLDLVAEFIDTAMYIHGVYDLK